MYNWRKLSQEDRERVLKERKIRRFPWHAPPHFKYEEGKKDFLITAACYEHKSIIGKSSARMADCESDLIQLCSDKGCKLYAWAILPNHYHLLIETEHIDEVLASLGHYHGRSSYNWNGEDEARGRKVWYRSVEREMRSERHFYATVNYVNHNPVKHGYVKSWEEWPYSSATEYIQKVGRYEAAAIWREYPILGYGDDWDID
jgi:putative transposase